MKAWDDRRGMHMLCYRARVRPSEIYFICSLTDGHENMAIVRTVDQREGILDFYVSPLMQDDFESYLAALNRETPVEWQPPTIMTAAELEQATQ